MSREDKMQASRRRRNSGGLNQSNLRLWLDESKLDTKNYKYVLANNEPNKIFRMTRQDDWEVVTDRDEELRPTDGLGSGVSVHAGMNAAGLPEMVVLLRKPLKYWNDDQAEAQRAVDATETMIREGRSPDGNINSHSYIPEEGIRVG